MKKITLLLFLVGTLSFAQQTVSLVSINGEALNDFKQANNATLRVGTSYDFVIDFTGQATTANNLIVKMLVGVSFADTANVSSVPITTADGQLTVTLTPTELVAPSILQIRTTTTTVFTNSGENIFDYSWKVEAALSTEDIAKQAFSFYPNPVKTEINLNTTKQFESFKIIDITGKVIKKGAFSKVINIEDLQKGVYFLGLDNNYQKFIKN
ncbi:T9SS type A sorting domain-containing protein [Algibacter mikhailovii]|uniref:Secretion system C-terminal sorting domain-containing protein n=1 Tax=Algibacter mikhailovii TaxID=425498 RepID=A0A918V4E3_9FLAO|nr:T9SS type A sorting domain-containing protein [Algibacter mikhailovii]GGZ67957.1 hypothetical protein GCM10007028_01090 [Algibacter mikhailovii]